MKQYGMTETAMIKMLYAKSLGAPMGSGRCCPLSLRALFLSLKPPLVGSLHKVLGNTCGVRQACQRGLFVFGGII